jgi:hypothetical protein
MGIDTKYSGQIIGSRRLFRPILLIFIGVGLFLLASKGWMAKWKVDNIVLMIGNGILFLATALSFYLCSKALFHQNVQGFLRMVYGGMFLKMGVCIASVLLWHFTDPAGIGKVPVLIFFVLYFLYTFTEVALLMRLSKQKKNA